MDYDEADSKTLSTFLYPMEFGDGPRLDTNSLYVHPYSCGPILERVASGHDSTTLQGDIDAKDSQTNTILNFMQNN
jgi:hypothetical protein